MFASEICIYVDTAEQTIPVKLQFDKKTTTLDYRHVSMLEKLFTFDFNTNSKTKVSPQGIIDLLFFWDKNNLTCKAKYGDQEFTLGPLVFTGSVEIDRPLCHQFSDMIYESLFQEKGIASLKILYVSRKTSGESHATEIIEADYDGGNPHIISTEQNLALSPVYIPVFKGRPNHFVYVSYILGQPKLCVGSLKENKSQRLCRLPGSQMMPTFSFQKDQLAYVCDATGNPEVYLQSFDLNKGLVGYPKLYFKAPNGAQASPSFSPDGHTLAFVSNKDGYPRIYLMEIDPVSPPVVLTKQMRENTSPAWSPDGTKLAYSAKADGVRQIWLYDFELDEHVQLTSGNDHKENPSWAPNSIHILYNTGSGQNDLFLTDIRTKKSTRITRGPSEKRFPSWEPFSS